MSIDLLYWLSVLLPMLMVPVVLPMVVLMARRKRLTDNPNARKMQDRPVPVMGGMVIMLVVCVSAIVLNLFYDLGFLYPAFCVMVILFIFGMLDDNIGLSWQFKLGVQIFSILLLFFGGNYGVHSLYGVFGIEIIPIWAACLMTLFSGILLLNAVNFVDGIDGLASGLGVLAGIVLSYWDIRHGFVTHALLSFVIVGVMSSFFVFNVFSERYKMYMGDSGSLVLGFFVFMSTCPEPSLLDEKTFIADNYFMSFLVAIISAMVFDLIRVALLRIIKGKSPFHPDRTHLHHICVDMGMSHLFTTLRILFANIIVIAIWYFTASSGMNVTLQYLLILLTGVVVYWLPYFHIVYLRDHNPERYEKLSARCKQLSSYSDVFTSVIRRIIDGRRKPIITHEIE